jgi:hypothetical protein
VARSQKSWRHRRGVCAHLEQSLSPSPPNTPLIHTQTVTVTTQSHHHHMCAHTTSPSNNSSISCCVFPAHSSEHAHPRSGPCPTYTVALFAWPRTAHRNSSTSPMSDSVRYAGGWDTPSSNSSGGFVEAAGSTHRKVPHTNAKENRHATTVSTQRHPGLRLHGC